MRYHLLQTRRRVLCSTRGTRIKQAIAKSSGRPGINADGTLFFSPRMALPLDARIDGLMSGWIQSFDPGTNFFAPATVLRPASTLQ